MEIAFTQKIIKLEGAVLIALEIPPTGPTRDLNPFFLKSTVFCAELHAQPLDVVIPYPPLDGICLHWKNYKNMTLSKKKWPSQCGSPYNYYWIRIFLFLQIASVSQLKHVCGPNIYHMCKYFGTIRSIIVENIEVYNDQSVHYKTNLPVYIFLSCYRYSTKTIPTSTTY